MSIQIPSSFFSHFAKKNHQLSTNFYGFPRLFFFGHPHQSILAPSIWKRIIAAAEQMRNRMVGEVRGLLDHHSALTQQLVFETNKLWYFLRCSRLAKHTTKFSYLCKMKIWRTYILKLHYFLRQNLSGIQGVTTNENSYDLDTFPMIAFFYHLIIVVFLPTFFLISCAKKLNPIFNQVFHTEFLIISLFFLYHFCYPHHS